MAKIALVGDHSDAIVAHRAIPIALERAASELDVALSWDWIHSSALPGRGRAPLDGYDGIWCVPGGPYANMAGVLGAIEFARTAPRPFLGTCAGFQHALIEYARDVWGFAGAHAEIDPEAPDLLIAPLTCPLIEVAQEVRFEPGSRLRQIYGIDSTHEEYQCSFGLNPSHASRFERGPLQVAARDEHGDVRAVELDGHPFFIASLFQFERSALQGRTPEVVKAFVSACVRSR